jgi:hypothetical protein
MTVTAGGGGDDSAAAGALPVHPHSATLPTAKRAVDARTDLKLAISNLKFAIRESLPSTENVGTWTENVSLTRLDRVYRPQRRRSTITDLLI